MAFSRLVFSVLALSISCYASNVPVFLWSDYTKTSGSNPLETVDATEFSSFLKKELADSPFTVIFKENNLSVEDFSLRDDDGTSVFRYLHDNIRHAKYFASVQDPMQTLIENAGSDAIENSLEAAIDTGSKFVIIDLGDAEEGESRAQLLQRHDKQIKSSMELAKTRYDNVIGIYTAEYPSWVITETHSRVRRQASHGIRNLALDGLLLYMKGARIHDNTENIHLDGVPTSSTEYNDTTMHTTLNFGTNTIVLDFHEAAGYWYFDSVVIYPDTPQNRTLYPAVEIYALTNYSYTCSENVTFTAARSNGTLSVFFDTLKIQPFFKPINESTRFGESFYCAGFFSAPIWSALFVVFLLLAITFYGITMMMDIRTMDRFDDPKGKTITINTAE